MELNSIYAGVDRFQVKVMQIGSGTPNLHRILLL